MFLDFGCPGLLCSPGGPSTPFGNPALIVIDSMRCLVIVASLCIVGMSFVAIRRVAGPAQSARFVGASTYALAAAATELVHMGDYASYRLALALVGAGLCLWGFQSFLREPRR